MFKKGWVYIVIAFLTLLGIFALEYNKTKDINWFPSYVSHHKIPYGTLVFNDLMEKLFPNSIEQVQQPPFEFLMRNDEIEGTYLFVNESVAFEEAELNTLLDWVDTGNTLFVASESFDQTLLDTLHLDLKSLYNTSKLDPTFYHQLVNPNLSNTPIAFKQDYYAETFGEIDTLQTVVIGEVYVESDSTETISKHFNIIRQPFGSGEIILSSFPKAFTNYFILKDNNREYTAGVLSYLNRTDTIYMDNFHKSGKSFYTSPMYLFLNTKELKWAYYLILIGALVYVIFEGKRKQRAIPIVEPVKNQTLAFTRTIADMYFENGEQKLITEHKIAYFLDYIRTKLHLPTQEWDETFFNNLASRSNMELEDVKALFSLMERLQAKEKITNEELEKLNKNIEAFKAKADGK
ncbi:DUF4350 domain-containing protein [Allomuricauda sp. NBRC 101325]|uniref:DUF4350 domain-containing protein n=1 Tax=Allomuricauda sp. NBRC 101325 TaxID=1113758 RepID=UPI0024A44830|nr:DUF4350 domain-containing protein [Muricauda sp. NBRC 101325]GLU45515.1 hypothetical protein Musp01_31390 [Muricauda sp. NBRC 101325]